MKRILTLSTAILMIACLFTACVGAAVSTPANTTVNSSTNAPTPGAASSTGEPTTPPQNTLEIPEGGYDGSEVSITFAHTMNSRSESILDQYITEFNKLYPNITIVTHDEGNWDNIFSKNLEDVAQKTVNISYCYPDHLAYYRQSGNVIALDELIESKIQITHADGTKEILGLTDEQKADFVTSFYEGGRQMDDGKMYSLPLSKNGEVLYYNKTFFEEHDLTPPTTWDEMWELCAQIKQIDPDCTPLGYDYEDNLFLTLCIQHGYDYTSATGDEHCLFNNADTKAMIKQLKQYYQAGYFTTQKLHGVYTSSAFTSGAASKCYMSICYASAAGYYRGQDHSGSGYVFEKGIAPVPHAANGQTLVTSLGPDLCIFDSENPQEVIASWLFVKYLTTCTDFQVDFSCDHGFMPVIQSAIDHPRFQTYLDSANDTTDIFALATAVTVKQNYYNTPVFVGSDVVRKEVGNLLTSTLNTKNTDVDKLIDELFKKAYDNCNSTVS